jgi:hypothetical protein
VCHNKPVKIEGFRLRKLHFFSSFGKNRKKGAVGKGRKEKEPPKPKKIRPHPKRGGAEIFKEFFSLV